MADILCDTRSSKRKNPLVVIVTHGDADGLVAATIVKAFEEKKDKRQEFFILSGMDVTEEQTEKLFDFICEQNRLGIYDKVYILDRPIPPLGWLSMGYLCDVPLYHIDHHITNHPSTYETHYQGKKIKHHWSDKASAAYLALDYFKDYCILGREYQDLYEMFYPLAEATSEWDTFHWKELKLEQKELLDRALSINAAEKLLGGLGFYQAIQRNLGTKHYSKHLFSYFALLQEAYQIQFQTAYDFAKRNMKDYPFKQYKLGVVYGVDVNHQSMVADHLLFLEKNPWDVIAFINMYGTVSFRAKGDVDVSVLAQKLGQVCGYSGGGHKSASGCKIYNRERTKELLLERFYQAMDDLKLENL